MDSTSGAAGCVVGRGKGAGSHADQEGCMYVRKEEHIQGVWIGGKQGGSERSESGKIRSVS